MSLPLERKRVPASAGEMAYVDMGVGPAVLLLHGFPTSAHLWRREAWLLAQRFRVIAPDLLGYGQSEQPSQVDLGVAAQARFVRELLSALSIDDLAVVGHGIGGGIALRLASEDAPAVRALALLDAAYDGTPEEAREASSVPPGEESSTRAEKTIRSIFDLGMAHRDRLGDEDLAAYLRPWLDDPAALFRAARALSGEPPFDPSKRLHDLPTLVMWGEADPFHPPDLAERLGDTLPGSTVALLPGCSHFVNEDAPQVVGPLLYEYLRVRYLQEGHDHSGAPVEVFLERPPARFG